MRKRYPALVVSVIALSACGSSSSGSGDSTGDDASVGTADGGHDSSTGDGSSTSHDGGGTSPDGSSSSPDSSQPATDGGAGNTSSAASWFSSSMYFNIAVDSAPVDANSSTIISTWVSNGGWGEGHIQVDFSIDVYYADASSSRVPLHAELEPRHPPTATSRQRLHRAEYDRGRRQRLGSSARRAAPSSCDDCHYLVARRRRTTSSSRCTARRPMGRPSAPRRTAGARWRFGTGR